MNPLCLRCKTTPLAAVDRAGETEFYQCPQCDRRYALRPGGGLGFRWGHPITLALYPVLFSSAPKISDAGVAAIVAKRSPVAIKAMVDEIALELEDPTQKLSEILACAAPEEALRDYLRAFCSVASKLAQA